VLLSEAANTIDEQLPVTDFYF